MILDSLKNQGLMRAPVKFTLPPVFEVACGVLFSSPQSLQTSHIGAFWETVRADFPRVEEAPPLPSVVEGDGSNLAAFEFLTMPPLRRTWMFSSDGRNLIQLQQDRFLFNWKRADDGDAYPSYEAVIEQFEQHLSGFMAFCRQLGVGEIDIRQFELIYVNHITNSNGLGNVGLNSLLVDHIRDRSDGRFLPEPEGFSWATTYLLPDSFGRLHVQAQTAVSMPARDKIVRLDLTARGLSPDTSAMGRRQWFDVAHEWITQGFADITSPVLHATDIWGRTS